MTAEPKPPVGRYLPEPVAEALYNYLLGRPMREVEQLVVALRQTKPLMREPK